MRFVFKKPVVAQKRTELFAQVLAFNVFENKGVRGAAETSTRRGGKSNSCTFKFYSVIR